MTVLLLNGSPHKNGTTYAALQEVANALAKEGATTEMVHLGTKPVYGCTACRKCAETKRCIFDDKANEIIEKMHNADAFVVGTPVYYAGPNGALCAVLDRAFFAGSSAFTHKPAAAVSVCRRGGNSAALDRLLKYFNIYQMPIVSSDYWCMAYGRGPEDFLQDAEGVHTMKVLGENMAHLLRQQKEAGLPLPTHEEKVWTHFIR